MDTGEGWTDRLSCVTRAGDPLSAEISASSIDIGGRTCIVALVREITLRRKAEKNIREMALLAQLNPAPVLRFDATSEILSANSAAVDILGADESGFGTLGSRLPGLEEVDLDRLIEGGDIISREAQVGERYFQLVIQGVPELGIGQVYGSDITERKSLEEQLRKVSQAVEQSPFAVTITDVKGTMEYINPSYTRITGYRDRKSVV